MSDRHHPLVGEYVNYYADPHSQPERGVVTSVNAEAELVFVRYGSDWTSKATRADERLRIVNGGLVLDSLKAASEGRGEP